jgi:hypothetical protein
VDTQRAEIKTDQQRGGIEMSKVKPGDVLSCEVCGLALIVDEECGCAIADLICCDEPMANKGPKPTKKAAAPPKKKAVAKKVKPAVKKPAAKKPAAKKKMTKK